MFSIHNLNHMKNHNLHQGEQQDQSWLRDHHMWIHKTAGTRCNHGRQEVLCSEMLHQLQPWNSAIESTIVNSNTIIKTDPEK